MELAMECGRAVVVRVMALVRVSPRLVRGTVV